MITTELVTNGVKNMTLTKLKNKTGDKTIIKNTMDRWNNLITEYELVKNKKHNKFRFASEFYSTNKICRQNFLKYYYRFKAKDCDNNELLPQKRGPKYKERRNLLRKDVEDKIVELRKLGLRRVEIKRICQIKFDNIKINIPSESTIYRVLKKYNLNKLNMSSKKNKQTEIKRIIKEKAGELGHIDCHYLPKGLIANEPNTRYYLLAIMDDATRIVWADVIPNIKSIIVMFSTLGIFNMLKDRYNIIFKEVLTDNGSEFGQGKEKKNKDNHPFELLLKNIGIKHRYTKPYRPQTNGKIERFWKTLDEDLIEETYFENIEEFEKELAEYLVYFNELRPHTSLDGKTPKDVNKFIPRIE